MNAERARVLRLTLHGRLIGYVGGFDSGRNVLRFADEFREDENRPTVSLSTHPRHSESGKLLTNDHATNLRLHPLLSNLLPEGELREYLTRRQKIHAEHEFELLSVLGGDLPGAIVARPAEPDEVTGFLQEKYSGAEIGTFTADSGAERFSLAGVQIKFSSSEHDGRFAVGSFGDWIIKTPSARRRNVPANEYTAMSLAGLAGIDIPEIRLIDGSKLENLSASWLHDEKLTFAIKRFDRDGRKRIHTEDFAQALLKYAHQKYSAANYELIGRTVYEWSNNPLADSQQLARRLLANVLLANGDAHLKNWSLIYPGDQYPRLSPAYDIVTTCAYIPGETGSALNLARTKAWRATTADHFQAWAIKSGIPWRAIRPHLDDVMEKARDLWPKALRDLPMDEDHKGSLGEHWRGLQPAFRIDAG